MVGWRKKSYPSVCVWGGGVNNLRRRSLSDAGCLRRGRHRRLASCQDVGHGDLAEAELVELFLDQRVYFFLQKKIEEKLGGDV